MLKSPNRTNKDTCLVYCLQCNHKKGGFCYACYFQLNFFSGSALYRKFCVIKLITLLFSDFASYKLLLRRFPMKVRAINANIIRFVHYLNHLTVIHLYK